MTSDDQWLSPEPVAWRYLTRNGWSVTTVKGVADFQQSEGFVVEPLYTALAQSDAEPEQWSQLRNELRNAIQSLETCRASEEGWKKRCQFVEAERDEARAALSQSDAEPIARARYHLRAADHALHEVEGDPFADHAHTLVHEAAFMITDEPELQVLRRLPESGAVLAQSDAEPQDVREQTLEPIKALLLRALERRRFTDKGGRYLITQSQAFDAFTEVIAAFPALAQSDAEPVTWRFKPPFEIYNGYTDIADATGHICTAENPEIATQLLTILNAAYTAPAQSDAEPDAEPKMKRLPSEAEKRFAEQGKRIGELEHEDATPQSDAEPVAWRYAYPGYPGHWNVTSDKLTVDERQGNAGCIIEPLYTTTPRPDASAGLIEAAEYCEKEISQWSGDAWSKGVGYGLKIAARYLRGAADRSGK